MSTKKPKRKITRIYGLRGDGVYGADAVLAQVVPTGTYVWLVSIGAHPLMVMHSLDGVVSRMRKDGLHVVRRLEVVA